MRLTIFAEHGRVPVALGFFFLGMGISYDCVDLREELQATPTSVSGAGVCVFKDIRTKPSRLLEFLGLTTKIAILLKPDELARQQLRSAGFSHVISFPEEVLRLRGHLEALQRTGVPESEGEARAYRSGPILFDLASRTLTVEDRVAHFTSKEACVLALLMRHANTIVSREALGLQSGQAHPGGASRSIDVTISTIRKRFRSVDIPVEIQAIHCVGYRLIGRWQAVPSPELALAPSRPSWTMKTAAE